MTLRTDEEIDEALGYILRSAESRMEDSIYEGQDGLSEEQWQERQDLAFEIISWPYLYIEVLPGG